MSNHGAKIRLLIAPFTILGCDKGRYGKNCVEECKCPSSNCDYVSGCKPQTVELPENLMAEQHTLTGYEIAGIIIGSLFILIVIILSSIVFYMRLKNKVDAMRKTQFNKKDTVPSGKI